ncbi:MAG: very short patch repair endonuclease, partial [Candidatus Thermoplasmatota archaeon]|nr:very short patch repair endonuclease [Candidatus Thermoplasmatota archaeon]
ERGCIYADGDYWHANPNKYKPMDLSDFQWRRKRTDKFINKILRANGYIVLRFWETDINDPKKKAWITEKISDVFEKYGEVRIFNQLDRIV